tara:strand:- start:925 stop:1146 length:222 start_codon:yes stop_codon:yes gene_type:complete
MDLKKHKEEFDKIILKYNLSDHDKAEEIAVFLTDAKKKGTSASEFAKLFNMEVEEATIFLSFIEKGIKFKENR